MKRPTTTSQLDAMSHIRIARQKAELKLHQAARKANMTASLLKMIEEGCVSPTGGELEALARAYSITVDQLQGRRPVQGDLFGGDAA